MHPIVGSPESLRLRFMSTIDTGSALIFNHYFVIGKALMMIRRAKRKARLSDDEQNTMRANGGDIL